MAIGAFGTISIINWLNQGVNNIRQITNIPLLGVGVAIITSLFASFFHLGAPKYSWRVLNHLRKSWLSREILFISLFAGLWAILFGFHVFLISNLLIEDIFTLATFICGIAALFCMQRVYQLRSMPGWNSNRTIIEFSISSVGLGCFLAGTLLPPITPPHILGWTTLVGIVMFSLAILMTLFGNNSEHLNAKTWRVTLLVAGIFGAMSLFIWPTKVGIWGWLLVFLTAIAEEAVGRWLFYSRRNPGI